MAFLGQDDDVDEMGDPATKPEAKAADPVADLVTQDEVTLIRRIRPAAWILFLLEDFREPGRNVLVLLHISNCQFTHLPPPSGWETPIPSPATLMPRLRYLSVNAITLGARCAAHGAAC